METSDAAYKAVVDSARLLAGEGRLIEAEQTIRIYMATAGVGPPALRGEALLLLGQIQFDLDENQLALQSIGGARDVFTEAGLAAEAGKAALVLGSALHWLGRLNEAASEYSSAVQFFDAAGNEVGVASAQQGVGRVLLGQDRPNDATELMRNANSVFHRVGNAAEAGNTALALAGMAMATNDFDASHGWAIKAVANFGDADDDAGLIEAQRLLGRALISLDRPEESVAPLEDALRRCLSLDPPEPEVTADTQKLLNTAQAKL